MFYIFLALLLFAASVAVHIFFCRHTTQSGLQAKAFVITAMIFGGIYLFASTCGGMINSYSLWGLPFRITAGIIFILLVPIYLCFYVLTQLTSPSKKILLTIAQEGGLSHSAIVAAVEKEDFIMSRLNDLCVSGCVAEINGRYILTSEGYKLAAILNGMQLILGRNAGG